MFKVNYSFFNRKLHELSLSNELIITLFHNLEKLFFYKSNMPTDKNYFICGLARSGSTNFLNMLYETGEFASFTYSDMPFLFSPNLWGNIKKIIGEGGLGKIERAHKDGIKIGINSPEAFEEALWMFIKKKKYISEKYISVHEVNNYEIDFFKLYISLIKSKNNNKIYLTKNNCNILRIKSLINYFPKSLFFILFRDPIQQSLSLINQHKNFARIQKENSFVLKYMNLLGHFDFGLNHKNVNIYNKNQNDYHLNDSNYWLKLWIDVYKYLIEFYNFRNVKFICYEQFCDRKKNYLTKFLCNEYNEDKIFSKIDSDKLINKNYDKNESKFLEKKLLDEAYVLYEKMKLNDD